MGRSGPEYVDKQCVKLKKNLLIKNENLIANCLSNQLLYDVEKSRCLDLEAEMSKVHNESKHISKLEREYLNLQLNLRAEIEKVKQHYKEMFESIKITRTSTNAKTSSLLTQIEDLKAQLEGNLKVATLKLKKVALGKLNYGYQWRPTGNKFALGELCPLTKLSVQCRTGHPLVSGLRLFKTYDGESFKASRTFVEKVHWGQSDSGMITSELSWVMEIMLLVTVKHSCFVRDINGVDLLKGSRSTNLYTISIDDMMKSSPICLLSKASKSKSWLWHRRLNHLNFGTINDLARKDLVRGLPRLKFEKDHLCLACQLGKSKKYSHKPKSENTNMEVLHTLHMDLCGPMRVQSINGKKYILVIVDDYSRFIWVKFL
ncbi:retrovirus-related pol polyprotein from transposon TNT 1-94 [Tanacetum coccineum]